jgi:hypothetical protein
MGCVSITHYILCIIVFVYKFSYKQLPYSEITAVPYVREINIDIDSHMTKKNFEVMILSFGTLGIGQIETHSSILHCTVTQHN